MTNTAFMAAAERKVAQCWKKLEKNFNRSEPVPSLYYNLKSRTTAGSAVGAGEIRLNWAFITNNQNEMLEQVVPHEVAHCWLSAIGDRSHVRDARAIYATQLTGRRTRRSPHGPAFMSVLRFLGGKTERTHAMTIDPNSRAGRRVSNTWAYKCTGCGYEYKLSTNIHNKMQRGQRRWHPQCGRENGLLERVI